MSIFNDKALKSVAEMAAKIMQNEELKGNQHKIDANKNGKIDAHDFKLLRGKKDMKKEEVEKLDEVGDTPAGRKALGSYVTKAIADKSKDHSKGLRKATSRMYKDDYYGKKTNEEVELDEAFPTVADAQKRHEQSKSDFDKKKISTGTVYSRKEKPDTEEKPKKKMSEMINTYNQIGLKAIAEVKLQDIHVVNADLANGYEETFVEEASSEEFKKELEDEKLKAAGKKKQPDVAKASVQAVANEEVEELDEKKGHGESDRDR